MLAWSESYVVWNAKCIDEVHVDEHSRRGTHCVVVAQREVAELEVS